jgi:hypothetical protein
LHVFDLLFNSSLHVCACVWLGLVFVTATPTPYFQLASSLDSEHQHLTSRLHSTATRHTRLEQADRGKLLTLHVIGLRGAQRVQWHVFVRWRANVRRIRLQRAAVQHLGEKLSAYKWGDKVHISKLTRLFKVSCLVAVEPLCSGALLMRAEWPVLCFGFVVRSIGSCMCAVCAFSKLKQKSTPNWYLLRTHLFSAFNTTCDLTLPLRLTAHHLQFEYDSIRSRYDRQLTAYDALSERHTRALSDAQRLQTERNEWIRKVEVQNMRVESAWRAKLSSNASPSNADGGEQKQQANALLTVLQVLLGVLYDAARVLHEELVALRKLKPQDPTRLWRPWVSARSLSILSCLSLSHFGWRLRIAG